MENNNIEKFNADEQRETNVREKTDIAQLKEKMRKNKNKKRSRCIGAICGALVVTACVWYGADVYREAENNSLKNTATIELKGSEDISDVAEILHNVGAVRHKGAFSAAAKMKKLDKGFKAGVYELTPGTKYTYILRMLLAGHDDSLVTFAEGLTQKQIFEKVAQSGFLSVDELENAAKDVYDYEFLKDIDRDNALEGYLFPETYAIAENQSAQDVVNMFLKQFDKVFTDEYKARAEELGMSIDEVVILASVIQGETKGMDNMRLVSDVFSKRLKNDDFLQSCATVQYILHEKKNVLSAQDIKIDSPYNTYKYKGLPKGPICSPGEDAIYAALYPAESEYYYFQSDSDGNMYFSKTFEEHENIRKQIQEGM